MPNELLTIGEFAKLAETTKRTVLWYEEKGILKPKQVDTENNYRFYATDQIIDFKAILLLRKLNFSIEEIKSFLSKNNSPEKLFNLKKKALKQEIVELQTTLKDTEKYYENIQQTGTLVNPKVKTFKSFPVYYIDKLGPYRKIGDYSEAKEIVKKMTVPEFKALSYTHYGSTKLLSMLWQELKKYRDKNNYKEDDNLPFEDLELSSGANIIEMLMPIK